MGLKYENVEGKNGEILNQKFTSIFRTGYVSVKNTIMPENFKQYGDRIQDMNVYDSDIWVCSFPKTGTTWTQEMVWCIANNLDFTGAQEYLDARFPFLEHSPLFDYSEALKINAEMASVIPKYALESVSFIDNLKQPRFIKSHLPWDLLPQQIQTGAKKPKVIYVTRNPKDTCVSYFHHCCLMEGYKGSFEEFFSLFIDNKLCFAPFFGNVLSFWKHRNDENVLVLRFEDLKKNLETVIRQVGEFLGKNLNDEDVEKLKKHLSFESMKNNKAVNYEHVIEFNKRFNLIDAKGKFMRSGQVGDHKAVMTDEMELIFDTWVKDNLRDTDFKF